MRVYVGCDLGGTNIKAGLVDFDSGTVLVSENRPTKAEEGHEAVIHRMAGLIEEIIVSSEFSRDEVLGVGVSAPGRLDLVNGVVEFLTNLPGHWINVPLAAELSKLIGLPVSILNDVRAITLGEFTFGAGKEYENMACFAIGTGIGGGLVIDGSLVLGISGTAGELGHQVVEVNGLPCGCGSYGCVEQYASGPAIATMGVKAVQQGRTTSIGKLVNYDLNKINTQVIAEAAEAGDRIAREIWDTAGKYLGVAVANSIHAVSPECVVITGGVARAGDLLLDPLRREVEDRVFLIPHEEIEIRLGMLGDDAGILGMACWASLVK